jgi:hypothetical protein
MYKAVCTNGELGNGKVKRRGSGTVYSSRSAAQRAIERYTGIEVFEVVPAGSIEGDGSFAQVTVAAPKKHGGARHKSGAQMPSGEKAVNVTTTFDPVDKATFADLGGGKLAIGLRKAAELVRLYQAGKIVEK